MKASRIKKKFSLQQDQSDCGVACLKNVLAYYRAELSHEKLREWSGTGPEGTSLLGLQQAARKAGFKAAGMKADGLENLRQVESPCLLHFTVDGRLLHYVVYYPDKNSSSYRIGDPARGVISLEAGELDKLWVSRVLLLMEPEEKLAQWQGYRQKKRGWLWKTLKEDVHYLFIAMVLGTMGALLNLSTAVFSQKLIDTILPGRQRDKLVAGLLLLGLLLILRSFLSYIRQSLLIRQGYQFNTRLTGQFYRHILCLHKSFFDNRKTGDLIARLNDSLRIQQAAAYILGEMSIQSLMLLVTLGLLFFYSWPIALFCLVMIPALYGIVKTFEGDIIRQQRESMIGHAANESNYVDSIRGIHTIKVMNREGLFANLAKDIFSVFQGAVRKLGQIKARFGACLEIVTSLFLLTVISWSAFAVLKGTMQTGQMIAILQLTGLLVQSAVAVALTNLQVQEAGVAMDRMYEFTTLEPEHTAPPEPESIAEPVQLGAERIQDGIRAGMQAEEPMHPGGEGVPSFERRVGEQGVRSFGSLVGERGVLSFERLVIEEMVFRFPGKRPLLRGINLEIKKGEIVALTGESGQGKSTLFQVLQKFYGYEGGHIWLGTRELADIRAEDRELADIGAEDWRRLIGVVPQDIALFSGNLLANICLDPDPENAPRLEAFCQRYGFDRYFESFPQSYQTLVGEGGIALSGGQKQLLALARCLYAEPALLLLDEPTSAMDAQTEDFVVQLLQHLKKDRGILVISHKDSLTRIADHVVELRAGVSAPLLSPAAKAMC